MAHYSSARSGFQLAVSIAAALAAAASARAGDVSVKLDSGAGFSVRNSTGATRAPASRRGDRQCLAQRRAVRAHDGREPPVRRGERGESGRDRKRWQRRVPARRLERPHHRLLQHGRRKLRPPQQHLGQRQLGRRGGARWRSTPPAAGTPRSDPLRCISIRRALSTRVSGSPPSPTPLGRTTSPSDTPPSARTPRATPTRPSGPTPSATTTTASFNSAFGDGALRTNTTGYDNTAVGRSALSANTYGAFNTAVGSRALSSNIGGYWNTAVGSRALYANTSYTCCNTAIGSYALSSDTTGHGNTATGVDALTRTTTGRFNTATGYGAMRDNVTGISNTATGRLALFHNTGSRNLAFGEYAGFNQTTGNDNIYLANTGVAAENGRSRSGRSARTRRRRSPESPARLRLWRRCGARQRERRSSAPRRRRRASSRTCATWATRATC